MKEMEMKKAVLVVAAGLAAMTLATAPAEARVKAGVLECQVSPSVGYIVGAQKSLVCWFKSAHGYHEGYAGHMTIVGLDVGVTGAGKLIWGVYAAATPRHGALAGKYAGASAEATVAAGLGANVLVGGSNESISLQPLSVNVQTGLNLAVGVSALTLDRMPVKHRRHHRHHHHH
jgi:hypothetical protein